MDKIEAMKILETDFSIEEMEELLVITRRVIFSKKKKEEELQNFEKVLKKWFWQELSRKIVKDIDTWRQIYTWKFKDAKVFWEMYDIQFINAIRNINVDVQLINPTVWDFVDWNNVVDNSDSILEKMKNEYVEKYITTMSKWRKENNGIFKDSSIFWDKYNTELLTKVLN